MADILRFRVFLENIESESIIDNDNSHLVDIPYHEKVMKNDFGSKAANTLWTSC